MKGRKFVIRTVAINGSQHEATDARDVTIRSVLVIRW